MELHESHQSMASSAILPSMDSCNGGCRRADGRAECGKRGTSWGPSRNRFRKSATAVASVTDVPSRLPSSIFDFVPGTSPSWSLKVCVSDGRTPYRTILHAHRPRYHNRTLSTVLYFFITSTSSSCSTSSTNARRYTRVGTTHIRAGRIRYFTVEML